MMPLMGSLERILIGNPLGGSYTGGVKSMWEQGSIALKTGAEVTSDISVRSEYIPCRENAYYTQRSIGWGTFENINWYFYDSEKIFLGSHRDTTFTALELAPVNCAFVRVVIVNAAENPITPTDVPNITIEDRSIWGWKDADAHNAIYSTKTVTTQIDHYYYQTNQNNYNVSFQGGGYLTANAVSKTAGGHTDDAMYIDVRGFPTATPTNIGDLVFEDRDVWGWNWSDEITILSIPINMDKPLVTAEYSGDLQDARVAFYNTVTGYIRRQALPIENERDDAADKVRFLITTTDNPNITPADMVNHGTWTLSFSDPVSEVWQSDGSVYYTPHNSEIQKGKILTITPPSTFKAVSLVVQDSTGQNSHDITGGAEVTLSESTEWVYLTVGIAENPDVNLTNIDSFREQWSYSYKDIPVPVEPHWDGENFVFTAADIQEGKAYQKSGNDIILVDDASSIALPIIPNVSALWTILIDNSSDRPLYGVEIRKTASGVTVGDGTINPNTGRSVILQDATGEVAFHFTKATLTAESLYNVIKIHGR